MQAVGVARFYRCHMNDCKHLNTILGADPIDRKKHSVRCDECEAVLNTLNYEGEVANYVLPVGEEV